MMRFEDFTPARGPQYRIVLTGDPALGSARRATKRRRKLAPGWISVIGAGRALAALIRMGRKKGQRTVGIALAPEGGSIGAQPTPPTVSEAFQPTPNPWHRARAATKALFPDAPNVSTSKVGIMLAVLAVVIGAAVSLLRTTGTGPLQSIWEEDARDILEDALNLSGVGAITRPIAGYYVLFPRLLGEVATLFPITWAAAVLSVSSAVVVAVLAVQVYVASGPHLHNRLARFLVAAPMLFAPSAENVLSEIYNRPVGLHFFAIYALFWLMLWTPASSWGKAGVLTTVAMTAFSTILIVGYVPLALLRLYLRRDRLSLTLAALTMVGTALQLSSVMSGATGRAGSPRLDPVSALASYLVWGIPNAMLGWRGAKVLSLPHPTLLEGGSNGVGVVVVSLAIPAIAVIAATVGSSRGLVSPKWLLGSLAACYSAWLHLFMTSANGGVTMRYVTPVELLLFAALVVVLVPANSVISWRSWAPLAVLGAFLLVVGTCNYRWNDTYRHQAPVWTDQIRAAKAECLSKPALSHILVRGGPRPWWSVVDVPCHVMTGHITCRQPMCEFLDPPQSQRQRREAAFKSLELYTHVSDRLGRSPDRCSGSDIAAAVRAL